MDNQTIMLIIAVIGAIGGIIARDRTLMTMIQSAREDGYKQFVHKEDYHREQSEVKERLTRLDEKVNNVDINCNKILTILEKNNDGRKT